LFDTEVGTSFRIFLTFTFLLLLLKNYTWVFVGWDLIEATLWWCCGVETIGRTVEELDEIYNQ